MASLSPSEQAIGQRNKIFLAATGAVALVFLGAFLTWAWWLTRPNDIPWRYINFWHQRRNRDVELPLANPTHEAVPLNDWNPSSDHARPGERNQPPGQHKTPLRSIMEEKSSRSIVSDKGNASHKANPLTKTTPNYPSLDFLVHTNWSHKTSPSHVSEGTSSTSKRQSDPQRSRPAISGPIVSPGLLTRLDESYCKPFKPIPTHISIRRQVVEVYSPSKARFTRTLDDLTEEEKETIGFGSTSAQTSSQDGRADDRARRESDAAVFRKHPGSRMMSF